MNKRVSKFELWTSQIRSLEAGLLSSQDNYVTQMPNSAGKTFIAELFILNELIKNPQKKCIYIAPFRALSNEKEIELSNYLAKLGYSVSSLSGSYETDIFENTIIEDTDVLIATPEKIDLLLRLKPEYFQMVSALVVDEGHIIGDISQRASLLEFLIIRLRIKIENLRILFISAVMPPSNADQYSLWLSGDKDKVIRSLLLEGGLNQEEWEPTRKLLGKFEWKDRKGRITYLNTAIDSNTMDSFVPSIIMEKQFAGKYPKVSDKAQTAACLAIQLLAKDDKSNCLIFCAQARMAISLTKKFVEIIEKIEVTDQKLAQQFRINENSESYYLSREWFGNDSPITSCIRRGIGIHYGDLPEALRKSIESDYNSGVFKTLLATNTIGQGLNLPIKNLIIHSTIQGQDEHRKPKTIAVRDFWNIIGRAGRAGKETEGQIVFLIDSYTDTISWNKYTNKKEIEPAESLLFQVLNQLYSNRTTLEVFEKNMSTLSESYLLDLLVEETIETDDQEIIELIIQNSLFKVQSEESNIDLEPLRKSFSTIIKRIRDEVPKELINVFGKTGLCVQSNKTISDFIDEQKKELTEIVESESYLKLLELIFNLFDKGIQELDDPKLKKLDLEHFRLLPLIEKWINGETIESLKEEWMKISDKPDNFHLLISQGFYYLYPWCISSIITILTHKFNLDGVNIPEGLQNVSSFVKFGVNAKTACLAKTLGIKSRSIALLLSEKSKDLFEAKDFIRWLSNLSIEDLQEWNINSFDSQNILEVALELTPNKFVYAPKSFEFEVKGIPYESERKENSKKIQPNSFLSFKRDLENKYDPYAIKLFSGDKELGFVPREHSKSMSIEIDFEWSKIWM